MKRSIIAIILAVGLAWPVWAQPSDTAVGSWEGTWSLIRDDPRIRTRGGGATLRLQITHDSAGRLVLRWSADRGICEDPNAGPCEWITAKGNALAVATGPSALAALLRISADPDDPFLLVLQRAAEGLATAWLVSEKGGIAYRLDAERE